jgi:hypothetical protein
VRGAGIGDVEVGDVGASSCTMSEQTDSVADAERRHIVQSQFCLASFTSSCVQVPSACSSLHVMSASSSTGVDSTLLSLSPSRSRYPGEDGISPSTSEGTSSGELSADSYIITMSNWRQKCDETHKHRR